MKEIAMLLEEGRSINEIAKIMKIDEATIKQLVRGGK